MPNGMRWVGLDVHANASIVAVFDDVTGEVITRRVSGRPLEVLDVLHPLPRPLRAVYEAGPTGYGLVRGARAEGIVCSSGNIDRRGGDRVKTDKRDAIRLARLFAAGDLRLVWIPSEEQEQLRDLVRCREDLRADLMRARLRLAAFCCVASATSPTIARLRCLRGINTLTALGLCAEIGDWRRFEQPDAIAKYVGLVPLRAQLRPDPPAGQDHQSRLHAPPSAAGRGRAALPSHARGRRQARRPPRSVVRTTTSTSESYLASSRAHEPTRATARTSARRLHHPTRSWRSSRTSGSRLLAIMSVPQAPGSSLRRTTRDRHRRP